MLPQHNRRISTLLRAGAHRKALPVAIALVALAAPTYATSPQATAATATSGDAATSGIAAARDVADLHLDMPWDGKYQNTRALFIKVSAEDTTGGGAISVRIQRRPAADADDSGKGDFHDPTGWELLVEETTDLTGTSGPFEYAFQVPVDEDVEFEYRTYTRRTDSGDSSVSKGNVRSYAWKPRNPEEVAYETTVVFDVDYLNAPANRPVRLVGTVSTDAADGFGIEGREVTVGLKTKRKSTSHPVAVTTTDADGAFGASVPTWWSYSRNLIVEVAAASQRQPRTEETGYDEVVATAQQINGPRMRVKGAALGYKPKGKKGDWAYLADGPISYDACKVIDYKVNTKLMPKGGLKWIGDILDVVSRQTGYRFDYAGKTSEIPMKKGHGPFKTYSATLTIAWATEKQVPGLKGSPVGLGGPLVSSDGFTSGGAAVLEASGWIKRHPASERADLWRTLLAHEIGHAMGLGHSSYNGNQAMRSGLRYSHRGVFEKGDLKGLSANGSQVRGCTPGSKPAGRPDSTRNEAPRWILAH